MAEHNKTTTAPRVKVNVTLETLRSERLQRRARFQVEVRRATWGDLSIKGGARTGSSYRRYPMTRVRICLEQQPWDHLPSPHQPDCCCGLWPGRENHASKPKPANSHSREAHRGQGLTLFQHVQPSRAPGMAPGLGIPMATRPWHAAEAFT
jgi:hypothetical protein